VDVWNLPELEDPNYEAKLELLIWYVDVLLPAMVGHDQYGPNIRRFSMIVDKVTINNKKKPRVTVKSEAFGWVTWENCYDKWLNIIPKKNDDSDWVAPAYDKEDTSTHKWHVTKWSDQRSGQVPGGGWAPGAFTTLNARVKTILEFRRADHAAEPKWKMCKFALTQIRKKHKITEAAHSNKRKRKKTPAAMLVYEDIVDDVDDDFSVGSENE
jgi:hypothetical protein